MATVGLVRPEGYYDIDATSENRSRLKPGTAAEECKDGVCNNIKINDQVFLLEPIQERGQLALLKSVKHVDSNGNGFQEAGELLLYTFEVWNTGEVAVSSLYIDDPLLDQQKITLKQLVLKKGEKDVRSVTYTIQKQDVFAREVVNTATVYGLNPRGFSVTDISGTTVDNDLATRIEIDQSPAIGMKSSVVNKGTGENGQFTLDDQIDYLLEVKHEGDIPVGQLSINDMPLGWYTTALKTEYMNNSTVSYHLSYIVRQADVERGYVKQSSLVEGRDEKYGNRVYDLSGETFADDQPLVTKTAIAPQGIDDSYTLYQGNETLFDVLQNDVMGSSSLTVARLEIVESPHLGSVSVVDGLVRYTPHDASRYGKDSFTYRITDNSKLKSKAVHVDIEIIQTVPIAKDDTYIVTYNFHAAIRPGENDYVAHSSILKERVYILEGPQQGNLTYIGDGVFRYSPKENYTGYDQFSYRIQDANGNWSDPAVVHLEVKGFFLPNVITPNDDDKNETFEVLGIYLFDKVELTIVDRFGRLIFHSSHYKNDWSVDPQVREGTYFYTFRGIKDNYAPIVRKGALLLVREIK